MPRLQERLDSQQEGRSERLHMPILRGQTKKSRSSIERLADSVLDKLARLESHKDDICFLVIVIVVNYFLGQVIRGLM